MTALSLYTAHAAPGSYSTIQDFSLFAANLSTNIAGFVVTAEKGPMNTRTLITTEIQRQRVFGNPSANHLGQYALQRFLRSGGIAIVVRVGTYEQSAADLVFKAADGVTDALTVSIPEDIGPGSWANGMKVDIRAGTMTGTYRLLVYLGEAVVEVYDGLLMSGTTDRNYIETRINGVSQYISVAVAESATDLKVSVTGASIMQTFAGGDDGAPVDDADIIGITGTTDDQTTGLALFYDREMVTIDFLLAPGFTSSSVVAACTAIVTTRGDCVYLPDQPDNLTPQEFVDWTNGTGDDPPTSMSSYLVSPAPYSWLKILDPLANADVYIPTSGEYAAKLAATPVPWFSAAGLNRGMIEGTKGVRTKVSQGDMDYMVSNGNCANMIRQTSQGMCIWSALTAYRRPSLLNHLNVVRMVLYAQRLVEYATLWLVHEQNDEYLWAAYKNLVNPILESIAANQGLTAYSVVCDATTQNPSQPNTCYGWIEMQPTPEADRIISSFNIYNNTLNFTGLSA